MTSTETPRTRGRPPAASRADVLTAAMYRFLRGRRVDVREIAAELGLGRTTIYRWFGSREGLIGEVLAQAGEPLLNEARAEAKGTGGPALLDTFDRLNRKLVDAPALLRFVEQERDAALRILTMDGIPQRRMVGNITRLIENEVRDGSLRAAGRAGDARLRDREARRGVPLQRRRCRDARRRRPAQGRRGRAARRQ